MIHSPYIRKPASIQRVMFTVLLALTPGIAAYVWQIGAGILVNLLIATVTALVAEALILRLRKRPVAIAIGDLSAVVTAWLVALAFPPVVPWWLTVIAVSIAIIAVKHLYGGLGQNPFNPAMAAYCTMIVAYPSLMSQWPAAGGIDFSTQLNLILGGVRELDAITGATALDTLRTGLRADGTVGSVMQAGVFGLAGGRGWEWIAGGYLLGGLFLLATRTITWHLPVGFLAGLASTAALFWIFHPDQFASPLFHLASGGAMLAAFFIVTDPVSGATTPRGKLIFAAGVGLIAYLIRAFGAYPEGIAFAVLLMNICVPLIDMKTQPSVFGHRGNGK
ncbi:RnfABCDGE type electron transport complex subunit D [Azoarcus communis]|uniref:Ion-translocating oxidoreductase complex subunit D n=1 Tax=Parazoarcus communis SWub3 = DSM 12120 TaxID=1121029 RepID=A0A323UQY1_9RHOO|nr:RnfABCDGE type electron transport complex subunit D [Parazoarcus communis]NMG48505.1 RnfABCDGE type electron transport complex subunit D [Parazoarcus communis]NMG71272.1 RnfABCDGE type electron transport complex subunit D [Parazoarcus communis SWub3 = DSM 12120]PZA15035.1 electron transport complex subunit RsxD [Azoarcus communis] [Parazoarcus communis SWub3 = DSM 12120]